MTQFLCAIQQAVQTLVSHPLRSFLTALTVTFGTAVLLVLVSYGTAAPDATGEVLRTMGSTQIKFSPSFRGRGGRGRRLRIRYDDLDTIREACPSVGLMAAGYSPGMGSPCYGPKRSWPWASMKGVGVEYREVAQLNLLEGRWFSAEEEVGRERVAILNLPLAEGLFPETSALGQWVEMEARRFTIIGVMNDPEAFAYSFYTPYSAAMDLGNEGGRYVGWLSVKPKKANMASAAIAEMKNTLATLYRFDPSDDTILSVSEQTEFIDQVEAVSGGLQWLVMTIAGVALVLGCLGAANVVGITVSERTSEIGLRKALGATPFSIRAQILAESLTLCLLGGGAGVLLGYIGVRSLGAIELSETVKVIPRADVPILGFGFAVLIIVGAVAGLPAAFRAAKQDPAVALRDS